MFKREFVLSLVALFAVLIVLAGCGAGSTKSISLDELDATIHPKADAVAAADKDAAKSKPATPKAATGGGGGEPFTLEKSTGTIKGVVLFEGAAPKTITIPVSDAGCSKCRTENSMKLLVKEDYVVNDGKFANVIVYVSDGFNKYNFEGFALPAARINQMGCQYLPHILAMMTDQKLEIQSSDDVAHNIHTSPQTNNGLNVSQTSKGILGTKPSFGSPEMGIPVKCDVHSWMNAYICVFEHPFFAISKEDGTFEIKLPPGKYELSAWQENPSKLKLPKPQKVEVVADKPTEIKIVYASK